MQEVFVIQTKEPNGDWEEYDTEAKVDTTRDMESLVADLNRMRDGWEYRLAEGISVRDSGCGCCAESVLTRKTGNVRELSDGFSAIQLEVMPEQLDAGKRFWVIEGGEYL